MATRKTFNQQVYEVVRKISVGKVATYGMVAEMLGTKDARLVGWALHANTDSKTPCHRVVNKDGRVAPNFAGPQLPRALAIGRRAFDGWEEQKRRLEGEGVGFSDEMHVDLGKYLWDYRDN